MEDYGIKIGDKLKFEIGTHSRWGNTTIRGEVVGIYPYFINIRTNKGGYITSIHKTYFKTKDYFRLLEVKRA